jgi:hypothetical protein
MDKRRTYGQDGQALILVAIVLAVTMMLVALAIEVGHLYGERRRMQNAADAGALAGMRYRCFGGPNGTVGDVATAEQEARAYAALNYQVGATPAITTTWLDPDQYTLRVVAGEQVRSFLGTILGPGSTAVSARAAAACGAATSACGLWPVAFDQQRWDQLYDNQNGCGKDFFLWTGDNPNNPNPPDCNVYWCSCFPDRNSNGKCDCTDSTGDGLCDCTDGNGDGYCDESDGRLANGLLVNDIIADEGRAYLDFSGALSNEYPDPCNQSGCGASELGCWIASDTAARVSIGACLPDLSGVRTGIKDEVNGRAGDAINVPLYDSMGCAPSWLADCTNGRTFHISSFGCIMPVVYEQNFEMSRRDLTNPTYKSSMIRVRVNCSSECETNCGGTGGAPPDPYGVRAVSLIKDTP